MERINEQLPADVAFLLRVGINTGEVLAGRMGEGYTVIGDTVNVAARLQAAARPGSVTVGETTYRATRDAIAYDELEPLDAEGQGASRSRPGRRERCWRSARPSGRRRGRRAAGRPRRRAAAAALARRAARARGPAAPGDRDRPGRGRQVAPAARADRARRRARPGARGRGRRVPAVRLGDRLLGAGGGAAGAVRDRRRRAGRLRLGEAPRQRRALLGEEVSGARRRSGSPRRSASSLGLEAPEGSGAAEAEDPQRMRETPLLRGPHPDRADGAQQPLVLAIEDIHWADEGMLDLIEHLARWVRGPLLIVCLARDELLDRRPDWGGGRRNATSISLEPLSEPTRPSDLVGSLLPGQRRRRRPGRAGSPSGRAATRCSPRRWSTGCEEPDADPEALPDTVHSVLAARLDSLPRVRAPPAPVRLGGRPELLGGRAAAGLRRRGPRGLLGARLARAEGPGDRRR